MTATLLAPPSLQARAGAGNRRRCARTTPYRHVLHAVEELGALAEALDRAVDYPYLPSRNRRVVAEAADVVVAMLVLIGRWWPDEDLLAAVTAKVDQLNQPDEQDP